MLRQSAFIFLLFLLTFSVLLECPSGQDDVKSAQDDVKLAQEDVQRWNLPEGAVRRLGGGHVYEIAYSPDGRWLAAAGSVGIWIYDARTLTPVKLLTGHRWYVQSISFSPDGQTIASGGDDGTVRLWDVETGKNIKTLTKTLTGHIHRVTSVRFSPDGETIATGSLEGTVLLWDVGGLGMGD